MAAAASGGAGASGVYDYKSLLFSPTKDLWDAYASSIGTAFLKPINNTSIPVKFGYSSTHKPMLSQKGMSCSTDTLFTLLFESEHLRPLFHNLIMDHVTSADDDCCIILPEETAIQTTFKTYKNLDLNAVKKSTLRAKYAAVLSAAQKRYDRMIVPAENTSRNRRKFSINSNELWKESNFTKIRVCPESSEEVHGDEFTCALFFDFLLTSNGMSLPSLTVKNPFGVHLLNQGSTLPKSFDTGSIICMALLIHPISDKWMRTGIGHWIGFYKNHNKWFFVDDSIGYIHEMMDNDWVNNVLIPRLIYTTMSEESNEKNLDKKVILFGDKNLYRGFDMIDQFVPFGEKLYPNINPMYTDVSPTKVYYPTSLILITHEDFVGKGGKVLDNITAETRRNRTRNVKTKSLLSSLLSKKTRKKRTRRFR